MEMLIISDNTPPNPKYNIHLFIEVFKTSNVIMVMCSKCKFLNIDRIHVAYVKNYNAVGHNIFQQSDGNAPMLSWLFIHNIHV